MSVYMADGCHCQVRTPRLVWRQLCLVLCSCTSATYLSIVRPTSMSSAMAYDSEIAVSMGDTGHAEHAPLNSTPFGCATAASAAFARRSRLIRP
jgi:hypothetical protein